MFAAFAPALLGESLDKHLMMFSGLIRDHSRPLYRYLSLFCGDSFVTPDRIRHEIRLFFHVVTSSRRHVAPALAERWFAAPLTPTEDHPRFHREYASPRNFVSGI